MNILLCLVSSVEATLADVSMLSVVERRELLWAWNETRVTYPRDKTLWELFSDVAEARAESIAVSSGSSKCTYGLLQRHALAVAEKLQRHGIKPGDVVGILGEQRISTIAGILGTIAAGAAYTTLDPVYPRRRLEYMLRQCGANLLIGRPTLIQQIGLDAPSLDPECEPLTYADRFQSSALQGTKMVDGSSAAYVLFTSGSTGDPKGSLITHRAVSRIIFDTDFTKLSSGSVFAQVSSLSFDISTLEIWGALLHGGELALIDRILMLSASEFKTELERTGTTDIHLTTTVFNTLVREKPDIFSRLQTVYVGGEQMNSRWARDVLMQGPPARLVNAYGPTETCWASFFLVEDIPELDYRIPIGRPVSNTSLYVVDDDLNLAPLGVEGELYIGGDGLATCYINNPDQTRDCFVDDFLGAEPSGRLYRTGDRVFRQEDGILVYLGRRDKQVKIRGHRIELGEIEAALEEIDEIEEAVVKIWPNGNDHRLAGYVLVRRDSHTDMHSILASLSNVLPEPMIPSHLEIMDTFPVTPNGKLDRTALPEPEWHPTETATATVKALSGTQQAIAEVWQEVLEHDQIGLYDSFFSVGGNSLMAAQLVARISRAVDQRVSIHTFFDHPNIAALASHVDAARSIDPSSTGLASRVNAAPDFNEEAPAYPSRSEARPVNEFNSSVEDATAIVTNRPIFNLIKSGELESIDAVTVTYIPDWLLNQPGVSDEEVVRSWFDDTNRFNAVLSTHLGRIAIATIPLFSHELYANRDDLIRQIVIVLSSAKHVGARTASLAGLIPSATGYGTMILDSLPDGDDFPEVTTGHETTASSVALAVERILRDSQRYMKDECVAFLGLGSIGASSLHLLLRILPHPRRLILSDVYGKYKYLEAERDRLVQEFGYSGEIDIVAAQGELPSRFYDATLVVGATNAPNVVDVDRLRPGVLIVDDSSPHCFSSEQALNRINERGDIMVMEGGVLEVPHAMSHVRYVPPASAKFVKAENFTQMSTRHPRRITSCVLSSLLCSAFKENPRTIGTVSTANSIDQYERLKRLGYRGAPAHCEAVELSRTHVSRFSERFGSDNSKA
jgi:amino acid adenylation domain-containing protein